MKTNIANAVAATVIPLFLMLLSACTSLPEDNCTNNQRSAQSCLPQDAVNDPNVDQFVESRTWVDAKDWKLSPVEKGSQADIPINEALAKAIGPSYDESVHSLAIKLWLIENAQYSVDAMYYIFAKDKVGYAVLGALCDAVKRGVDVRLMVDALGSMRPVHNELKALKRCEEDAGFIKTADGQLSTQRARVQVVIFNALTHLKINRRSHDKLLIVDGQFPDSAMVMTGGRNISLDYYGIKEDGSADPTAFRDTEVLLKPTEGAIRPNVGDVAEAYFNLLFVHEGNRLLQVSHSNDRTVPKNITRTYQQEQKTATEALAFLKAHPDIASAYQEMRQFLSQDFAESKVRLAHQLNNLTSTKVATRRLENLRDNPNSISYQITSTIAKFQDQGLLYGTIKIISPYLFISYYEDSDEQLVFDGAKEIQELLENNPKLSIEIVTNSVMTSDNFMTQALIDIDMIPRLLLNDETREKWQAFSDDEEWHDELTKSEDWQNQISHSRLRVYQVGKLDSVQLGGTQYYGKLHAKFLFGNATGFIGTSNFDYRSNLYNNEVGFIYHSAGLSAQLDQIFEELKATSYRWGSREWLEMRHKLMESDDIKSIYARTQRTVNDTLYQLGFQYLM